MLEICNCQNMDNVYAFIFTKKISEVIIWTLTISVKIYFYDKFYILHRNSYSLERRCTSGMWHQRWSLSLGIFWHMTNLCNTTTNWATYFSVYSMWTLENAFCRSNFKTSNQIHLVALHKLNCYYCCKTLLFIRSLWLIRQMEVL